METQNITLAVPKKILLQFKKIALRQQKSINKLMIEMMENAVLQEEGYRAARDRSIRRLTSGADLQTHGAVEWNRDDLHDR